MVVLTDLTVEFTSVSELFDLMFSAETSMKHLAPGQATNVPIYPDSVGMMSCSAGGN